jgi:putative endonuclease
MPFSVYAIYNSKHDKIYIGQTENLEDRLRLHNEKTFKNSYTAKFDGGWLLIYREEKNNRQEALIREKQLKSYRGREFIRQQIRRLAD